MSHLKTSIIELRTDDGVVGLGEFLTDGLPGDALEKDGSCLPNGAMQSLNELLIGEYPRVISRLVLMLEKRLGRGALVAGLDFALHDLKGRALGVPVYQLLGGMSRERVPLV
jgi:L-alanine-DL-glutamate epimerase-like enolase superfamily enzyme